MSLRNLQRASRVSKLWLDISQPIIWRHLTIWSYNSASSVLASSALGGFRTDELDVFVGLDEGWGLGHDNVHIDTLVRALKGLKKLVLKGENARAAGCDWVAGESLKDLKALSLNVAFSIVDAPPAATFQLSTLNIGPLVNSPSFVKSIFSSSSNSLTSLKLHPSPSMFSTLRAALPSLSNSLQSFDLTGELPGLEALLPNFKVLHTFHLTFHLEPLQLLNIDYLNSTLLALPASAKNVKLSLRTVKFLSLRTVKFDMEVSIQTFIGKIRGGNEGWERLTVLLLDCRRSGPNRKLGEKIIAGDELDGWAELEELYLKHLHLNAPFQEIDSITTTSVNFQLTSLSIGPLFNSPSFTTAILYSSCQSLTFLRLSRLNINPAYPAQTSLLVALPFVKDTLQSLEVTGELSGLEKHLPSLRSLTSFKIVLKRPAVGTFTFIDSLFLALSTSVTSVKLSLTQLRLDTRHDHIFNLLQRIRNYSFRPLRPLYNKLERCTMASINTLPPETITRILECSLVRSSRTPMPSTQAEDREALGDLERACRVSKLFAECGQPILWRNLTITTGEVADAVLKSPAFGRYRTDEVDIQIDSEEWEEMRIIVLSDFVKALKGLRKFGMRGKRLAVVDFDWVGDEALRELDSLSINLELHALVDCDTPPANFSLTFLDLGPLVNSNSFINSIFTSSAHSLISLKLGPTAENSSALISALPLVSQSLQSLHLTRELSGIEPLIPRFKSLKNLTITFQHGASSTINHFENFFATLPPSTTFVKFSLELPALEMRYYLQEGILPKLENFKKGFGKLKAVECELRAFDSGPTEQRMDSFQQDWPDMVERFEARGVTLSEVRPHY
ncbi:hypothetical protein P7C70_g5103, partial [Phenoliferia sp. Uapishka_3]